MCGADAAAGQKKPLDAERVFFVRQATLKVSTPFIVLSIHDLYIEIGTAILNCLGLQVTLMQYPARFHWSRGDAACWDHRRRLTMRTTV